MGKYFENATLDGYWTRIVNATKSLCGNIGGTGFEHIHDALIGYTGLQRVDPPRTPGDYLVGICKCAKKIGGETDDKTIGLAYVAELLENPVETNKYIYLNSEWHETPDGGREQHSDYYGSGHALSPMCACGARPHSSWQASGCTGNWYMSYEDSNSCYCFSCNHYTAAPLEGGTAQEIDYRYHSREYYCVDCGAIFEVQEEHELHDVGDSLGNQYCGVCSYRTDYAYD